MLVPPILSGASIHLAHHPRLDSVQAKGILIVSSGREDTIYG